MPEGGNGSDNDPEERDRPGREAEAAADDLDGRAAWRWRGAAGLAGATWASSSGRRQRRCPGRTSGIPGGSAKWVRRSEAGRVGERATLGALPAGRLNRPFRRDAAGVAAVEGEAGTAAFAGAWDGDEPRGGR